MFCRNCGQKLADGDKFCSGCGTRTQVEDSIVAEPVVEAPVEEVNAAPASEDKPLFEPFDFKAFGFDFADLGLGTGVKKDAPAEEEKKPAPPVEKFDWNTGEFPDRNATTKTEEINFNWSLTPEEPAIPEAPEVFVPEEPAWTEPVADSNTAASLEEELFGDIGTKTDETRKQSEEIDKFFTFHKKNEEFQKILDREYEKVRSGNILTEEMNAAEAVSEEKFTSRQPEDPMEALFAAEGVIKGYEPKPLETDVLERIEAAEEEKRIREEAARLVEEEKAKKAAEEAAAAEAETAEEPAVEEITLEEPVAEEPEVVEVQAVDVPAEEDAVEAPAEEAAPAEEEVSAVEELVAEEPATEEPAAEEPEKTKQVDKAAILAGMAMASDMVQRDREFAAAQEAAAVSPFEDIKFDVPDFLGHQDDAAEEPAVEEITLEEPAIEEPVAEEPVEELNIADVLEAVEEVAEEPAAEETEEEPAEEITAESVQEILEGEPEEELELDIFEQLEEMETPAEEIILPASQTIEDLFAEVESEAEEEAVTEHTVILTEDSVAEILRTVEEDTTKDDTMVFTAHALGAILAEAEQEDPDAKEVVVSLEELTSLEQQAAEGTLPELGAAAVVDEVIEEVATGGKGRTFLKICLVVLVILLVIEIAGVAIKIAAPTSGAANFIDNQLEKVFQLIGEEDSDQNEYNA